MPNELRWRFKAVLKTLTPLHIGDGGADTTRLNPREDGVAPEVATVFLDHSGKPYLPATSPRGWLRDFARGLLDDRRLSVLFGSERSASELNGGCLRFFDGTHRDDPPTAELDAGLGVHWDATRHTCVASHVVIDRNTGAAAQNLLYFEEYIPPGMTFDLEFELRSPDKALAAAFYQLLRQFERAEGSPTCLGAAWAEDWGRVRLDNIQVDSLGYDDFKRWLGQDSLNGVPFQTSQTEALRKEAAEQYPAAVARPFLAYKLRIQFDGPFVSNDPSRARKREEPELQEGNLTPLRLPGTPRLPYLPISSLRGALRSHAEKILRTMGGEAPAPTAKDKLPIVRRDSDLGELDAVSLWFGAPGWRSPIQFHGQRVEVPGEFTGQELIAIDRFTGGGAPGRKFRARYFWKPIIALTMSIDCEAIKLALSSNPLKWHDAWLLLALTLRDFADGFISLGGGAAKGFGACKVSIEPTDTSALPQDVPDPLRRSLETGFVPRDWPSNGDPTADETPMPEVPAPGTGKFFNPFHFCPVEAPKTAALPTLAQLGSGDLALDRYQENLYAGYFDCTLTTETPTFMGGTQTRTTGRATKVGHYKQDCHIAIPAATLRGLISAHFETLTNSPLRVLGNSQYTVRKPSREACLSDPPVWRKKVPLPTFEFFAAISPDLLPMSDVRLNSRPDRLATPITAAEKLFGFVEIRDAEKSPYAASEKVEPSPIALAALAGRLRFTDATYTGNKGPDPQLLERTLRILSSPKPPCPAMYFFNKSGTNSRQQYISKTAPGEDRKHNRPKGRKFYLHHTISQNQHNSADAPWQTRIREQDDENLDQKMRIRPVCAGAQFRFRIHFENVAGEELGLLLRSIRPAPEVRYKLGLGKLLGRGNSGLGSFSPN